MFKFFGIVFLCCSLAALSVAEEADTTTQLPCPTNEHYSKCDICPTTCAALREKCPTYIRCPSGCFCNEGYARNDAGVCIPKNECTTNN